VQIYPSYYETFSNIRPDDLDSRTELAKIYQYQKRYDQAEKVLLECINIRPDDLDSRTELAKIYQYQAQVLQFMRKSTDSERGFYGRKIFGTTNQHLPG
jgi:tetratricopeptide (TPR) repeat protein